MNRHEMRKLDLNLMVIFERVMQELSVTLAAQTLGISQSTASAALGRLRNILDDPLLIPIGRHMEPTSKAKHVFKELKPALDQLCEALHHLSPRKARNSIQ